MADFPTHPDHVTPDWLSEATGHSISQVAWEPIGTGQVGDSVRFTCTHEDGATSTLAAKFPAADPKSRGTAALLGLYAKEVRFYADIASSLDVRVPRTFAAQVSADGGEFVLLFEDLGPARGGNQLDSCSIEDARAAIRQAAAFHAPSWHNEAIISQDWLQTPEAVKQQIKTLYPQAQAEFAKRYSETLEPEYMALCETIAAMPELFDSRNAPPQCLTHGDFRLDNLLFDIRGGAEPVAVLDWQTVAVGQVMNDIGYFLGTGIGDDLRRAHESDLLDLYCAEMTARGVALSRSDIWDDYRRGALHGVTTAVFSAAFVERTERGDANFLSMARGGCALALEHDSIGALTG